MRIIVIAFSLNHRPRKVNISLSILSKVSQLDIISYISLSCLLAIYKKKVRYRKYIKVYLIILERINDTYNND